MNNPSVKDLLKKSFKVNLLIHKGEQPKLEAKLIKWLLSSGKFIVVLVELVVIGAFVFRYKLDTDLADLQDLIKEQVPYLQSLKNDEKEIRKVQFQLSTARKIIQSNPDYPQILSKIAELTPKNIKVNKISIDKTRSFPKVSMSITGQTSSDLALSAYIHALKKEALFSEISLSNISFEGQSMTVFTITASVTSSGGESS